ncbi:MAG: GHKL domain-containing protein [Bacilli bacterium]
MNTEFLLTVFLKLIEAISFTILSSYKNELQSKYKKYIIISGAMSLALLIVFTVIASTIGKHFSDYLISVFVATILIGYAFFLPKIFTIDLKASFFFLIISALGVYMSSVSAGLISYSFLLTESELPYYASLLIEFGFSLLIFLIIYVVFAKNKINRNSQIFLDINYWFFGIFIFINLLLQVMQSYISYTSDAYLLLLSLIDFFYILMMFFIFYALMRQGQSELELMVVRELWNEDKKHLEMQKESIDIINIKCHDLRHQIRDYRQQGTVTDKMMNQLEDSIHIYDSVVKTGNDTFDVILSSFSLRCQKNSVELTSMVDGKGLAFIDDTDMYSLFTNVLDNALEYENTVNKDKRFISLTIKRINNFINIHCENYYEGKEIGSQEEIKTTKGDTVNHGYGMKSIRNIVEKYDGQIDFMIMDDMFHVIITLPVKEATL